MGDNTKLYIATETYNKAGLVVPLLRAAVGALRSLAPENRARGVELMRLRTAGIKPGHPVYTEPEVHFAGFRGEMTHAELSFYHQGEQRSIAVLFACDVDVREHLQGPGIVVSMGAWGSSVQLAKALAEVLNGFGRVLLFETDFVTTAPVEYPQREFTADERVTLFGTPYYAEPEFLAQTGETARAAGSRVYVG